jgi:hypothetical protein
MVVDMLLPSGLNPHSAAIATNLTSDNMDLDFITAVLNRLPTVVLDLETPQFIDSLNRDGYTVDEAVEYCMCMEEFSPTLDEETALDHMAEIREKVYRRRGV